MYVCNVCDNKTYRSLQALNKHNVHVHNVLKQVIYECEKCDEAFTSKRKLGDHFKAHRNEGKRFKCNECGNFYSLQKYLKQHFMKKHNSNNVEIGMPSCSTYQCHDCDLTFFSKLNIIKHVKIHKRSHKNLRCPVQECNQLFNRYISLRSHLTEKHHLHFRRETFQFSNKTDFIKWKAEKEKELKANYVTHTTKKSLKEGVRIYYDCHRSFAPRVTQNPKKNTKSMGTNKIGRACPSTLTATFNGENKVSVVLYPTHIGHSQEIGRLKIDETDRNKIAGKLSQGVTVDRVLNDIRENISCDELERIHLVEKKDINNIMRDYSIGYATQRHKNDAISVKLWVQAMRNLEDNPILYYKDQGEENDTFSKDDFLLVIMTEFQAKSLASFGTRKICIDGTHGLCQYDFQLYTFVVVDEFGNGIPVSFCFSNRSDKTLFITFYQMIKEKVGLISTNVFMSDDYPAFYLAWISVMGEVPHRLLCTWHVNKNWVQSSNKIINKDKRSLVLKSLKVLQKELDEEAFLKQLETFTNQLMTDPDTFSFFQYFSRQYLNRTDLWAYCYRKYLGLNTNMYLESLHKIIKHFYLQGKKCKRLDKTINALMQLVRDKAFERVIKLEKHKCSQKIQKIRDSHKRGEKILPSAISKVTNDRWCVISRTDPQHRYFVEKVTNTCVVDLCELKCQICRICIHSFKCSCPDNVVNCNICKHIHACSLKFSLNTNPAPSSEMSQSICSYDFQKKLFPETRQCDSNKDLIKDKLETLLGLNNKFNLSHTNENKILKSLDKIIETYAEDNKIQFKIKANVNINENIEPQARMFSSKAKNKKRNHNDSDQNPLPYESKVIKLALLNPDAKVINIQTGFDHAY